MSRKGVAGSALGGTRVGGEIASVVVVQIGAETEGDMHVALHARVAIHACMLACLFISKDPQLMQTLGRRPRPTENKGLARVPGQHRAVQ